ncbi:MAG: DNRLRE domain-containing protein [Caldilineaceae bacterium]|nr:DNRLRE domain-containing protein [Caldilineaceae bacterium]
MLRRIYSTTCWAALPIFALLVSLASFIPVTPLYAAPATQAVSTTVELTTVADARTQSGSPATNFGSGLLWVGHPNVHYAFVQFDLSVLPANATIDAAELRLDYTGVYTTPNTVEIGRVEAAWNEATLTYALPQPDITWGGPVQTVDTPGLIHWEVAALVRQWHTGNRPNHGFGLRGQDGPLVSFRSRESASGGPTLAITYTLPPDEGGARPDLGDAPDSSNSLGIVNMAYPGVPGNFPTVWGSTPAGQPAGPRHANQTGEGILGAHLSREREADSGPDQDGVNNILNGGLDNADNDRGDDGWRNRNIRFFDCRRQTLTVRVSKAPNATLNRMYLNVWFDGNRDGDWDDIAPCQPLDGGPAQASYEWIVQNYIVDMTAIPAGGYLDFQVNTERVLNQTEGRPHWMRFMLSEAPAIAPAGGLPDGRGPHPDDAPGGYLFGETEDVKQTPPPAGEEGVLVVEKSVHTETSPVLFGDMVTYEIVLRHEGGSQPLQAELRDELPYPLHIHPQIVDGAFKYAAVESPTGGAGPLLATLDLQTYPLPQPPTQMIKWQGTLAPDSEIKLSFDVHVLPLCGPNEQTQAIRNLAEARPRDGNAITDEVTFNAACPGYDGIVITQHSPITPTWDSVLGGQNLPLRAELINNGPLTATVALFHNHSTNLPEAAGVAANKDRFLERLTLAPGATQQVDYTLRMESEFTDELMLPTDFAVASNLTFCILPGGADYGDNACPDRQRYPHLWGQAAPLTVTVRPGDLGDAPDSTNHAGVAMSAYPGVMANFPTVFDPALGQPQGPRHRYPRPFHLGPRVSREVEADIGPDQDGPNNIEPAANLANLDDFDDGSRLTNLADCQPATAEVLVAISPQAWNWFVAREQPAYLNVWIDSNRDGDWDDGFTCQSPTGQQADVVEHILIDQPIDVIALGPGLHALTFQTNRVRWPAQLANQPAWMRFTLSEQPSHKTLVHGAINYGDGRGYSIPFQTGETEDHLFKPAGGAHDGPDLAVRLAGRVTPDGEQAHFKIEVTNRGSQAANGATLTFQKPEHLRDQKIVLLRAPGIPSTDIKDTGEAIQFLLPHIEQNNIIAILIGLTIPAMDGGSKDVAYSVQVELEGDIDSTNNEASETLPGLLSSPLIGVLMDYADDTLADVLISGRAVTCRTQPTLAGQAAPDSTVEIMSDSALLGAAQADTSGRFVFSADLGEGLHRIWVRYPAPVEGATAGVAPLLGEEPIYYLLLKVDPSLPIDPLSLTFTDSQGRTLRPVTLGYSFGVTQTGTMLRSGETYTVGIDRCGNDPNVMMQWVFEDIYISNLLDKAGNGRYTGSFTFEPAVQSAESGADSPLYLIVTSGGLEQRFALPVQPWQPGIVRDAHTGQPLADAHVTARSIASLAQLEPQVTDADGRYSFDAPAGVYQLEVVRDGYQPYRTGRLIVETGVLAQEIALTPVTPEATTHTIYVDEHGFSPALLTVEPGSVVEWVNVGLDEHSVDGTGWESGHLATGGGYKVQLNVEGAYTYRDTGSWMNTGALIVAVEDEALPTTSSRLFLPVVAR